MRIDAPVSHVAPEVSGACAATRVMRNLRAGSASALPGSAGLIHPRHVTTMLRLLLFLPLVGFVAFGIRDLSIRGAAAIERVLVVRVDMGLDALGFTWARVSGDGLEIEITGNAPAPDEQALAIEASRSIVRFGVVIDRSSATLAPPVRREPVLLEIHHDDSGLTLIGNLHGEEMRRAIVKALGEAVPGATIDDLTGIDAARPPEGWGPELPVAMAAVRLVPRAFIRVQPRSLLIEGVAPSLEERDRMAAELLSLAGPDLVLTIRIRVPGRVIAPFVFAMAKAKDGAVSLESCAARTEAEAKRLVELVRNAGADPAEARCAVGLGGPFGDWPGAVQAGLRALAGLPAGRVEVNYRALTLSAAPPTRVATFEAALAALTIDLPAGFSLTGHVAAGREATQASTQRGGYWLRLAWDGQTALVEGQVEDDVAKEALERVAAARFGGAAVLSDLDRVGGPAPAGWQKAALAAIVALSESSGSVEMTPRGMVLRGRVEDAAEARADHDELATAMPEGIKLRTELAVDLPAAVAALPLSPERCVVALNLVAREREILFDLGSARIDETSREGIDALARILDRCPEAEVEIGGHTDNRGREEVNNRLSRQRAEAVVNALLDAGVARRRLAAVGYGESEPIAPNDTAEGRTRNRRIAFKLMEGPDVQP